MAIVSFLRSLLRRPQRAREALLDPALLEETPRRPPEEAPWRGLPDEGHYDDPALYDDEGHHDPSGDDPSWYDDSSHDDAL